MHTGIEQLSVLAMTEAAKYNFSIEVGSYSKENNINNKIMVLIKISVDSNYLLAFLGESLPSR